MHNYLIIYRQCADSVQLVTSRALPANSSALDKSGKEDTSSGQQTTKKPKKQTKKMNTLTARVTARYVADEEDPEVTESHNPTRRKQTKTKVHEPQFIVLSPEAATKAIDEQDLVFGTCSQLEREGSPTMLRDMQTAIRESENRTCQERQSRDSQSVSSRSGTGLSRLSAPRNLWSVAARDLDGSLVNAEVLDMVDDDVSRIHSKTNKAPTRPRKNETLDLVTDLPTKQTAIPSETQNICPSQPTGNNVEVVREPSPPRSQRPMPHYAGFTEAELRQQVSSYGFKPVKSRKKMIDLLEKCWESRNGPVEKARDGEKSSADVVESTTAVLLQPQDTGKKTQKTTKAKPKPKPSTQSQVPADKVTTTTTATTKPQPATPSKRKQATKSTAKTQAKTLEPPPQSADEIEDSEGEVIPSPSRLQTRYTSSLSLSPAKAGAKRKAKAKNTDKTKLPISTDPSTDLPKRRSLPDLETQITQAVRAQSQSQSPPSASNRRNSPTWHEKVLMYDPIILEDFAAWLNTTGLGLVGEDREVGPGAVREWCERKGICCCWKRGDV